VGRWIPILVCAAACSFEIPDAAVGGDGGPGDRDGDGVRDQDDLCPDDADASNLDYDDDGHGDVCDHCPHLADMGDKDGDRDGVGDACDPDPMHPTERAVLWLNFDDMAGTMAKTAGWDRDGTWALTDGWLRSTSGDFITHFRAIGVPLTRGSAATRVRIDQGTGNAPSVALVVGLVGAPGTFPSQNYQCALELSSNSVTARSVENGMIADTESKPYPGTLAQANTTVDLELALTGMDKCSGDNVTTMSAINANPSGEFELFASNLRVSFDYVFLVDSP
jgi:hypothetical protein